MKEQGITLNEFMSGLRPYEDSNVNSSGLVCCFNLIPRPQGLVGSPTITQSISAVSVSHPWPQIFLGHVHRVCCTEDKIYTINADWSLTLRLDLAVYYNQFPNAPQGTWHFADFFNYVVLTNGGVTVIYNPPTSQWEYNNVTTLPTLGTVLNFNGQIVGSGRATVAGDAKTAHPDAAEVDENYLIWGGIGSATFRLDQSNTRGYRPMPWFGEIYKAMQLGNNIVVYGSSGVAICRFHENNLGIVKVIKYGAASREAAGGDESQQAFVDTEGNLRVIKEDLTISDPMYKEFFSTMLGREIITSYNDLHKEFYITDGVRAFVLTSLGLGEIFQAPTTLDINAGVLIGFYTDLGNAKGELTTDAIDFGTRASKSIEGVEVGGTAGADVEVAIDYKTTLTGSFSSTGWVTVNPQGFAVLPVAGVEFRIKVRCSTYVGMKVSYLSVRVKFDDKRFIRGTSNANKASA